MILTFEQARLIDRTFDEMLVEKAKKVGACAFANIWRKVVICKAPVLSANNVQSEFITISAHHGVIEILEGFDGRLARREDYQTRNDFRRAYDLPIN